MDPYKFLRITANSDGSLTRANLFPLSAPSDADPNAAVLSKDLPLEPSNGTWLRLFLPNNPPPSEPLPLLVYFHGGGFVLYSAATAAFHDSCCRMARELPALVVSVEYSLAPEHRLPAAYDDAFDAVSWLRRQAEAPSESTDPWLRDYADFSRCFLAGSSSGGNIAYHAAKRLLAEGLEGVRPLRLRGLVLDQPFFGGAERTPSEAASVGDRIIPLAANDLLWELALPVGANRDHVFCNPMVHHQQRRRGEAVTGGGELPRCLVRGYLGDPLIDRQREFVSMLEEEAEGTVALLDREGFHGIEMFDRSKADLFIADVKEFLRWSGPSQPSPSQEGVSPPYAGSLTGVDDVENVDSVCGTSKY